MIFHGITAVAELKGKPRRHRRLAVLSIFHGITAVAELKGPEPAEARLVYYIFHGITAVAELKVGRFFGINGVAKFSTASPPWPN